MLSSIPVNLIRQWCYCPRVVYYQELAELSFIFRPPWVSQGEAFHREETGLWHRRNLSRFKLEEGKKHYNVSMDSKKLGIHGIADMIVEAEKTVYPIEFKLSASSKKEEIFCNLWPMECWPKNILIN